MTSFTRSKNRIVKNRFTLQDIALTLNNIFVLRVQRHYNEAEGDAVVIEKSGYYKSRYFLMFSRWLCSQVVKKSFGVKKAQNY